MNETTIFCRYCGRPLKSKESVERGYGLVCYQRFMQKREGLIEKAERRKAEKVKRNN